MSEYISSGMGALTLPSITGGLTPTGGGSASTSLQSQIAAQTGPRLTATQIVGLTPRSVTDEQKATITASAQAKGREGRRIAILQQLSKLSVEHRNWVVAALKAAYGDLKQAPLPVSQSFIDSAIKDAKLSNKPELIRKFLISKKLTSDEIIVVTAALVRDYGSLVKSPYPISNAYIRTRINQAKTPSETPKSEFIPPYADGSPNSNVNMQLVSKKKPIALIIGALGAIGIGGAIIFKMKKR